MLLATPVRAAEIIVTFLPENPGQRFGADMGWTGDVNGDGVDDFLVIDSYQAGNGYSGRAYVYFGGPQFDEEPDLILQQDASGRLEQALEGPFDFNGDGFGDLAVSSPSYDIDGMANAGAVFIYFGGPELDAVADHVIPGPWRDNYFGELIARAGHFNTEDDYDDIVVKKPGIRGWTTPPTVEVYLGGPSPSLESAWGRQYADYGDDSNGAVAFAGDTNGDGADDLIVGIPWKDGWTGGFAAGEVKILHGGELMWNGGFPYQILFCDQALLGTSADGAFDFNGDGYDDVIATAPYIQESRLILGDADPSSATVLSLIPGENTAGLGDVDGDGFDDLAITDLDGAVWIFLGGAEPDTLPDQVIRAEPSETWMWLDVARAGDFDADGLDDIAVRASWHDEGYVYDSFVRLYRGIGGAVETPLDTPGLPVLSYDGSTPNPFNAHVEICYSLGVESLAHVRLFDARGRLVRTLFDGMQTIGSHAVTWDGRDECGRGLPSGVYFVQVLGQGRAVGGRVTLVK